jgi:hypothetical protein
MSPSIAYFGKSTRAAPMAGRRSGSTVNPITDRSPSIQLRGAN